jgi:ankyrin repeat protein
LNAIINHDGGLPLAKAILDSIENKLPPLSLKETSLFIRHAVLLGEEAAPEAFASHRTAEEPDRPLHDDSANGFAHLVEALPEGSLGDELGGVGLLGPIDIIHLAIESNDQPFVDAVLDRAEEEEGPLPSALCALLAAARNNQEEMCQFLVERGALDEYDLVGPGDAQMPHILDAAIMTGNDTLLKQIMDTRGYHPMESPDWAITPGGDTILEMVAEKGSTDLFQKSVSWGGIIKPDNSACTRALLRATSKGKIEIVSHFLKHGFDVNGTYHTKAMEYGQDSDDDSDDYDPYEDQDLYRDITLLLQSVVPWDHFDAEPQTSAMAEFLLDRGAKVDAIGSRGRTALAEVARQGGDISIAKLLIERGANPLTGAEKGESALEWAISRFDYELVELSLQTIIARGYQSSKLEVKVRHYISNERIFGVTDGHTEQWLWFLL